MRIGACHEDRDRPPRGPRGPRRNGESWSRREFDEGVSSGHHPRSSSRGSAAAPVGWRDAAGVAATRAARFQPQEAEAEQKPRQGPRRCDPPRPHLRISRENPTATRRARWIGAMVRRATPTTKRGGMPTHRDQTTTHFCERQRCVSRTVSGRQMAQLVQCQYSSCLPTRQIPHPSPVAWGGGARWAAGGERTPFRYASRRREARASEHPHDARRAQASKPPSDDESDDAHDDTGPTADGEETYSGRCPGCRSASRACRRCSSTRRTRCRSRCIGWTRVGAGRT